MAKEREEESNPTSGRQRGTDDAFTGRSAQLTAIVELLRRRCNAAIPEVDLGTGPNHLPPIHAVVTGKN